MDRFIKLATNRNVRIGFAGILVFLILINLWIPGQAGERRKVRVAFPVMDDSDLYRCDENGELSGMMYEYFETLRKCTGWDIEYVVKDIQELYDMLVAGEIDLMGSCYYSDELAELYDFPAIASGYASTSIAILQGNNEIFSGDIMSMDGKTIAISSNQIKSGKTRILENFCETNGITVHQKVYETVEDYFEAPERGETDMILIGNMAMAENMREVLRFSSQPYYTVVAKEKPEIFKELNEALYTIHIMNYDYGEVITKKYLDRPLPLSNAFSKSEKNWIKQKQSLTVAVPMDQSFGMFIDGDGGYQGFANQVCEYFADMIGIEVTYILVQDYSEAVQMVKEKKADMIPAVFSYQNSGEINDGLQLYPYCSVEQVRIRNEKAADKKILAALRSQRELVEDLEPMYLQVIDYDDLNTCVEKVAEGYATDVYMDSFSAQYHMIHNGYRNLNFSVYARDFGTMNLGVAADADPELLTILEKARMFSNEDEISSLIMQNVINQKTEFTVANYLRENILEVFILSMLVLVIIISCVFWAVISNIRQKDMKVVLEQREKNEQKLNQALIQAQEATRAKSRFLSNISHEMRTPLNGVMGMLTLIQTNVSPEKEMDYLKKAKEASEQLLSIINSVLDMSRIESGSTNLNEEPFYFREAGETVRNIIQVQAEGKGIEFRMLPDGVKDRQLLGDITKVKQILLNITSNAVKFTSPGGAVEIKIREIEVTDKQVIYEISCEDDGIGMSREFCERIFQPFSRDDEADRRQIQGTGLGMAITKSLVEMMGGQIWVESELGVGTKFSVRLPFVILEEVPEKEEHIGDDKEKERTIILSETGRKVLLAEDNELNLEIAIEFLAMAGLVAEPVADGRKALDMFKQSAEGEYAAVFMDIQMPVMDGYTAANAIRCLDRRDAATVPIFAMTANAFKEDIDRAREAGMTDHIAKPVDYAVIVAMVERYLG